jgi:hypothetical protein
MPGVPGAGGVVPKRSDQRRRENKPDIEITPAPAAAEVVVPEADPKWHPVAVQWFDSLAKSGQAVFYEPSDWATAYLLAESISRELKPQPISVGSGDEARIEMVSLPPKGASLAAWLKGMTVLMVTEGDRRRARVELHRAAQVEEHADVTTLDDYRTRFGTG